MTSSPNAGSRGQSMSASSFCNWLKYRHLVLIDTLGKTRNMHQASQQMSLSQPALSKMLKEIENLLGFEVFERLPRSMMPTPLGERVLRYAQSVLNDAEGFVAEINSLKDGGHGHLRVGGIFAATSVILPRALLEIKRRWPLLEIQVIEQTSVRLLEMLEDKELDLAIGRFNEHSQRHHFDYTRLEPEAFCLAVNSQHPLLATLNDSGAIEHLEELLAWPWLLYPQGTPIRERMEQAFLEARLPMPGNTIETISMQTFLTLIMTSPIIGMLPEAMVSAYVARGEMTILQTPLNFTPQDFGILTHKEKKLSSTAQEFLGILLHQAKESH
ncbi:LysR family transcriptional regulator [Pokkaliibacter sp. CJK22405]|uniref:LysR family transcriptional regulator n=1 Tax=Pokkaliibacter sp. CJK22405 TaxID=3384615 RepID=UPI003984CAF4